MMSTFARPTHGVWSWKGALLALMPFRAPAGEPAPRHTTPLALWVAGPLETDDDREPFHLDDVETAERITGEMGCIPPRR